MQSPYRAAITKQLHSPAKVLQVLMAGVFVSSLLYVYSISNAYVDTNQVPAVDTNLTIDPGDTVDEWVPELPVRLVIPAIAVDAPIQYVGLTDTGTGEMAVPDNFTDVGWYEPGVRPGMRGSAVMAGHYNGKQVPEAVFYDLDTLQVGDEVVIMSADRIEDIFIVVKVATYAYDAATDNVFTSTDGKKRLNLITCSGTWLADAQVYDKRTVVFTELATDTE